MDLATIGTLVALAVGPPAVVPPCAVSPLPPAVTLSLAALDGALSGADLAITMYGRGAGRVREINPALSWAQDRPLAFGLLKGSLDTLSILACSYVARRDWRYGLACFGVHLGIKSWVVCSNLRALRGER